MNKVAHFLVLIMVFLGFTRELQAINADSLRKEIDRRNLENPQASEELFADYRLLARTLADENKPREAVKIHLEGLAFAEKNKNEREMMLFLLSIAKLYYFPLDEFIRAREYLIQAEEYVSVVSDKSLASQCYSQLSEVNVQLGLFNEALDYQLRALNLAEEVSDTLAIWHANYNLGNIHLSKFEFQKALGRFKVCQSLLEPVREPILEQGLMATIGSTYINLGQPDEALSYIESAFEIAKKTNYPYGIAYCEAKMGEIMRAKGKLPEARQYLQSALERLKKIQIKREWAQFAIGLANVYNEEGQVADALNLLDEVEAVSDEIHSLELKRDACKARAKSYELGNRKDKAYECLLEYVALQDSILGEEKLAQMAETESDYRSERTQEAIQQLETEKRNIEKNNLLMIFGGGLAALLALLGVIFLRYKSLNKLYKVLAKKNQEIYLQNERLARSNEELQQFAHVTAHDLREPLRSIAGFSTLLERRFMEDDTEGKQYVAFISSGVKRMDTLLRDLLSYSVIGILEQNFEKVRIDEIIQEVLRKFHEEHRTEGARINIQNLPEITADRKQMRILFEQLLDNAIKFRRDETPEIAIQCEKKGDTYIFSVQDNGIGIQEEYKDKIFSLFLKLNKDSSRYAGTGIGLSICRKIVQQHKGQIWIESIFGKGTTVFFMLPDSPLDMPQIDWRANDNLIRES
ncbi:MAG: ATP-binding protein [Bacteroidota bacterium]